MCDIQNILTFGVIFLPSPTSGYGVTEIFNLKLSNLGKTLLKQDNYWNTVTNTWKSNKPALAEAPTYEHKFHHFKPQIKEHSTALRSKHFASKKHYTTLKTSTKTQILLIQATKNRKIQPHWGIKNLSSKKHHTMWRKFIKWPIKPPLNE